MQKKVAKKKSLTVSADELEMDAADLEQIYMAVRKNPERTSEEILDLIKESIEDAM